MSGSDSTSEKTEDPTPKRLRDARRRGQVGKSAELASAAALIAVFGILSVFASWASVRLADLWLAVERSVTRPTVDAALGLLFESLTLVVKLSAGPLALGAVVALLTTWLQIGPIMAVEAITPKLERIDPVAGFKRLFSMRTVSQFALTLLKLGVIASACALIAWKVLPDAIQVIHAGVGAALAIARRTLMLTTLWCGGLFLALGFADLLLQRHHWMKELRMARHEVKREFRENEGDPLIKHTRRNMANEPTPSELMGYLEHATIVIAEPGGRAVALMDRPAEWPTPLVVIRAADEVAREVLERARRHRLPVLFDPVMVEGVYPQSVPNTLLPEEAAVLVRPVLNFLRQRR